jgi:spore coat protein U-like protein
MTVKRFFYSLCLGLAVALAWSLPAMAECTISATAVSFGTYNVFSAAPLDSTGTVTFRCGNENNITIYLNRGGAATFDPRRMLKGSEALNYNLYRDAARTTIWGDGTAGTQIYTNANPPNNQHVTVTIFGRIPAGQDVSAGSYSNIITATINF